MNEASVIFRPASLLQSLNDEGLVLAGAFRRRAHGSLLCWRGEGTRFRAAWGSRPEKRGGEGEVWSATPIIAVRDHEQGFASSGQTWGTLAGIVLMIRSRRIHNVER
jgi:hypothetical protein